MDLEIITPTSGFDFKTISLADPQPLNGQVGFYFTQLSVGEANKSLCLQLPECLTKQGIVSLKNVKYLDLMFERANSDELLRWIEQLEYTCQDIIDTKKDLWFQTELTRDDIETMMTQITRHYQSGKYALMRVFVETVAGKSGNKCIAYDENEMGFDLDILEANKSVVPLIMIEGVKFSSRSFEISLKLVQVMVLGKGEKKSSCLIKRQMGGGGGGGVLEKVIAEEPSVIAVIKEEPIIKEEPAAVAIKVPMLVPKEDLEEITIDYNSTQPESINLKKPNDVYYELYKKAREKAKHCRIAAIEAYLEAKQIKTKYMLFDEDDSDDDLSDSEEEDIDENDSDGINDD